MFKMFTKKKRLVAAAASAMLVATAFQPGGCTVTVDEALLQQLLDVVSTYQDSGFDPAEGGFMQQGPHDGCDPAFDDCHHDSDHDSDHDFDDDFDDDPGDS